jgi:hypothetical protein
MKDEQFSEDFLKSVADHKMEIIRDDGINRHIRFKRPDTYCMGFDLITWPGYLCYTGDMGTYVFTRVQDMFTFFRRGDNAPPFRISFGYWAEKATGVDSCDGLRKYSPEMFQEVVKERLENCCEDLDPEDAKGLRSDVDELILYHSHNGEYDARTAVDEFEWIDSDGNRIELFTDFWEVNLKEFTFRFLWCCHALEWAIGIYDSSQPQPQPAEATA